MLLPRTNRNSFSKGYVPAFTLPKWKTIFRELGLGSDLVNDLRTQPPEIILKRLHPLVTNPGKGVYLEYDLTDNSKLYRSVRDLISVYGNISYQSAGLLAQAVEYGPDSNAEDGTKKITLNHDYFRLEAQGYVLSLINVFEAFSNNYKLGANKNSLESIFNSFRANIFKLSATLPSALPEAYRTSETVDNPKSAYIGKSKDNADRVLALINKGLAQFIDLARRIYVSDDAGKSADSSLQADLKKTVEALGDIGSESAGTSATTDRSRKILTVRLYPEAVTLMAGNPTVNASQLSSNRFIITKIKESNLALSINNIVALNTEDTQWLPFYAQLFTDIINSGNPVFAVVAGRNRIERCSLAQVPRFTDTGDNMQAFSLNILSSKTGLDFSEA